MLNEMKWRRWIPPMPIRPLEQSVDREALERARRGVPAGEYHHS